MSKENTFSFARGSCLRCETGRSWEMMEFELVNTGLVNVLLGSRKREILFGASYAGNDSEDRVRGRARRIAAAQVEAVRRNNGNEPH